jgi:probable rRNA maturation factor
VITFPLSDAEDQRLSGELVVSTEMALATAAELGTELCHELALYIVHGLLHLCGYDDRGEADAAAMSQRQSELLETIGSLHVEPSA